VLLFVLLALPAITSAQMTDPDGSRRDTSRIAKDFMMFESNTALVPEDMTFAMRLRAAGVQKVNAKVPEIYAFLFGRVQLNGSIGIADSMQSASLGAKIFLFKVNHATLSVRYRFDMFGDDYEFKSPMRFHNASLVVSSHIGQLLLTMEFGSIYSNVTGFDREIYHFGIVYPMFKDSYLLIESQNYGRQDEYYAMTSVLGFRHELAEWFRLDWGYIHRMNDEEGQSGLWLGLMMTI
jgi:hypothetical protein